MNNVLAVTTSINALLIFLTIYRLVTLHRAWSSDPLKHRTAFRRYVLCVLYTYLASQCISIIARPLQVCRWDAQNILAGKEIGGPVTCGVANEGWFSGPYAIVTNVAWIATDFFVFTSVFERFLVFRSMLHFHRRLVPALRGMAIFLWAYSITGDIAQYFITTIKPLSIVFLVGIALFWLYLIVCDVFISVVMLRAFLKINSTFKSINIGQNSVTSHPSTSRGGRAYAFNNPSYDQTPIQAVSDAKTTRAEEEGRKLIVMLVFQITFDFVAIGTHLSTFVSKTYHVEMGQLATAWVGLHYLIATMFLSRLKNSMTGRSFGASSDPHADEETASRATTAVDHHDSDSLRRGNLIPYTAEPVSHITTYPMPKSPVSVSMLKKEKETHVMMYPPILKQSTGRDRKGSGSDVDSGRERKGSLHSSVSGSTAVGNGMYTPPRSQVNGSTVMNSPPPPYQNGMNVTPPRARSRSRSRSQSAGQQQQQQQPQPASPYRYELNGNAGGNGARGRSTSATTITVGSGSTAAAPLGDVVGISKREREVSPESERIMGYGGGGMTLELMPIVPEGMLRTPSPMVIGQDGVPFSLERDHGREGSAGTQTVGNGTMNSDKESWSGSQVSLTRQQSHSRSHSRGHSRNRSGGHRGEESIDWGRRGGAAPANGAMPVGSQVGAWAYQSPYLHQQTLQHQSTQQQYGNHQQYQHQQQQYLELQQQQNRRDQRMESNEEGYSPPKSVMAGSGSASNPVTALDAVDMEEFGASPSRRFVDG
ncbi:hypothetical protein HDV00_010714 [Rhizophlyctis rosea]|nr:hypothetical protein HDV00_010714 [Rhizophlyctis rosea]